MPKKRHLRKKTSKKQVRRTGKSSGSAKREYIKTGVDGLDKMFKHGIPKGVTVLVAGGAGSGKTILCLEIIANACKRGEKCLYMSFEESKQRLREHMDDFGWSAEEFEKKRLLKLARFRLFDIARSVEALLAKEKGDLEIKIEPMILPEGFKPGIIVVDSLTAIASAFVGKERNYRTYIEQLFRFFEYLGATAFLITETEEVPKIFSPTGVEEFLADGVIVLYNIRKGNGRERGIEILKMRGASHNTNVVALEIADASGIKIRPNTKVFTKLDSR